MMCVVVFLKNAGFAVQMSLFTLIQAVSIVYSIGVRPFEACADNLVEVLNDAIFILLTVAIFAFRDVLGWSEGWVTACVSLLTVNSFLIAIIILGDVVINVVRRLLCK